MKRHRRGATRTQFLAVIVLSVIVVAVFTIAAPLLLLLRESSRRTSCRYNLLQYGIGIHTYHDTWNKMPSGANAIRGMGPSYQVAILPMMEQGQLFMAYKYSGDAVGNAQENEFVAAYGDKIVLPYATCPSTSMPHFVPIKTKSGKEVLHQLSSYVGVAGADNFSGPGKEDSYQTPQFAACCSDLPAGNPQQGKMGVNGAMILNGRLNFGAVRDGLSNTIFLAEQAGWGRGAAGKVPFDASSPHGWIAGTAEERNYEKLKNDGGKTLINSVYNLTTIVYQPGSMDADHPGISAGHGPNNPLISGHSGSFGVQMGDGSVRHLPYRIDLIVLKRLAGRADGLPIDFEPGKKKR